MTVPSGGFIPDLNANAPDHENPQREMTNAELRNALEGMYARQQQLETEMANTRAAANLAEARLNETTPASSAHEEVPLQVLMRTLLETLTAQAASQPEKEVSGSREWKPPSWDGRAETFRDYLLRMRSSYRVRSALKPTLSREYYWDVAYSTLPPRERARMRHFWEKGSATYGKDPEAFFSQLEDIFADSNEKAKALEQLTNLKHTSGQPWHEHQLEFDGLLLSADGDRWSDDTKIGYLKNTFSNAAKVYTATVKKMSDYYEFSEEVERIMTNLEITDQFKTANKRWIKEKGRDSGRTTTVTTQTRGPSMVTRVDADGDTVMAPTYTSGDRRKRSGDRKLASGSKQRAKWVDVAERERRREKRLCFRCGGSGHRIRDCPYAPPAKPTTINAAISEPMLEDEDDASDAAASESGKE